MTSPIDKVQNGLQKLKSFGENPSSLDERDKIVKQLKNDLCFFQNLPPCLELAPKECILAREVYEYATLISAERQDIESFEKNMAVLRTYYDEFDVTGVIPQSSKKYSILGLYLLYLLSYNKISEYHTEIELIPLQELGNVYIKVPVNLETFFSEGSYNKILNTKQNVPLECYNVFINRFVNAIQFEMARSAEKAYESLSLKDMQQMFQFGSQDQVKAFIEATNMQEGQRVQWEVKGDRVFFVAQQRQQKEIPNQKMINLCLDYAGDLNRII